MVAQPCLRNTVSSLGKICRHPEYCKIELIYNSGTRETYMGMGLPGIRTGKGQL